MLSLKSNSTEDHWPMFGHSGIPLLICESVMVCNEEKLGLDYNVHGIPDIIPVIIQIL